MSDSLVHSELWAKKGENAETYPLLAHMLDAAAVGTYLFRHWLRPELRFQISDALGENAECIVAWVVGMHDLGKANPLFQFQHMRDDESWRKVRSEIRDSGNYEPVPREKMERWNRYSDLRRHERVSAIGIGGMNLGDSTIGEQWATLPALGHHGYFTLPFRGKMHSSSMKRADEMLKWEGWKTAHENIQECFERAVGVSRNELPEECDPAVSILLSGLTVLADRLASNNEWVENAQAATSRGELNLNDPTEWYRVQLERADEYVRENLGIYSGWESQEHAESVILQQRSPRHIQKIVRDAGDGLVGVMAPTGIGKTEAALLRHAQKNERLLFLLPTQATTNALMRRVQRAFSSTPNVASLAHSLASVEDFYDTPVSSFHDDTEGDPSCRESGGLYPASFVRAGMSRLMAAVSVGTVDQSLKAGLRTKWLHLLLLSLANAHIVVDEVHTLDHYQTELLSTVLEWLGKVGARVTLLTATFPSWQYRRLVHAYSGVKVDKPAEFPAVAVVRPRRQVQSVQREECALEYNSGGERVKKAEESKVVSVLPFDVLRRDIELNHTKISHSDNCRAHAEWVIQQRLRFPQARIGVIVNQVDWAQSVARQLSDAGHNVVVLHSAMTSEHRRRNAELLEKIIGPNGNATGVTVVGTQAIEASLDIDMDILTTDLCPSASLIQRIGRVWRRQDTSRSERIPEIHTPLIRVVDGVEVSEKLRYPYYKAEMLRTSRWIQQHRVLKMPEECQEFVDAASVSFDDLKNPSATDADFDQVAAESLMARKGKSVSYEVEEILDPEYRMANLHENFSNESALSLDGGDARTRLIEEESVRVILLDSGDSIPGGWQGDVEELRSIRSGDRERIRKALRASMPMRQSKFSQIESPISLADAKTLLNQYYAVEAHELYDSLVGFLGFSGKATGV